MRGGLYHAQVKMRRVPPAETGTTNVPAPTTARGVPPSGRRQPCQSPPVRPDPATPAEFMPKARAAALRAIEIDDTEIASGV